MTLTILSHTNDGTMTVLINDRKYIYFLDAMWISTIVKKAKHRGGKALQLLKLKARDYEEIKNDNDC